MPESNKSGLKRRRYPRVKTPVYYRPASITRSRPQTSNISLGGMCIYSNEPLKEGKLLEIELILPNGHSLAAKARVVWIKALPPGSDALYIVGLEFTNMSKKAVNKLKAVLEKASSEE